jgi:hypothetical protein
MEQRLIYEDRKPTLEEKKEISNLLKEWRALDEAFDLHAKINGDERYYEESLAVGWAIGKGASMVVAVWLGIEAAYSVR